MYKYITGIGTIWVGETPPPTPSNNVIWMRSQKTNGKKGYHELLTWNIYEKKWRYLSLSESESASISLDTVLDLIKEHNESTNSHKDIRDELEEYGESINKNTEKISYLEEALSNKAESSDLQKVREVAESAAPQETTYTKEEVDNLLQDTSSLIWIPF